MIEARVFKIDRPAWTYRCASRLGEGQHAALVAAWWTGGWTLLDDRLVTIEVDRAPGGHAPGVWVWLMTPLEYEGEA